MQIKTSVYSQQFKSDPTSANRASVVAVTAQVASVLPVAEVANDPKAAFENSMQDAWGGKLKTTTLGIYYVYEWNPETQRFEWKCYDTLQFEVAYASGDTVVVEFSVVQVLGS